MTFRLPVDSIRVLSVRMVVFETSISFLNAFKARTMRYLASKHIFKELTPDVFTNNRTSSSISKGKSLQEIKDK